MRRLLMVGAAVLWMVTMAPAQGVPDRVAFQGKLTDAGGTPITGTRDLTFRLYDASAGGPALWSETQSAVSITNGLYTVYLGATTPLSATVFNQPKWMSVEVNADGEMSPRYRVSSSPFALRSQVANGLEGLTSTTAELNRLSGVSANVTAANLNILTAGTLSNGDALHRHDWTAITNKPSVAVLGSAQTFTGANTFSSALTIGTPTAAGHATTKSYVDTADSALTANVATHATQIAGKVSKIGDSMTGPLSVTWNGGTAITATTSDTIGIFSNATAASGIAIGLSGQSASTSGRGVYGAALAGTGATYGVYGYSASTSGKAVNGEAAAGTGTTYGVYGSSASTGGFGLYGTAPNRGGYGLATAGSGLTIGLYGESISTDGRGVFGYANVATGANTGVWGESISTDGRGVLGLATAGSGVATGVYGESASTNGYGVYATSPFTGVFGKSTSASGSAYGVHGESASTTGRGVNGEATAGTGATYGVRGESASTNGTGVCGVATSVTGSSNGVLGITVSTSGSGVYGFANVATGTNFGVFGLSASTSGTGVRGLAAAGSGFTHGLEGISTSSTGFGVYGAAIASSGLNYGVYGHTNSAAGYAGYFSGNVHVTGALTKGSGTFKIDHPLDPANKYLSHSFVESPDMKNLYDGNVVLDADGAAWVELPLWFEALNRDFRYQLTAIGAAAPGLHVARKITERRFRIAGGAPGLEVSWQVTGSRQDPYAKIHPLKVEEDKRPEDRGRYLHPDAYGKPKQEGVGWHEPPAAPQTADAVKTR